ncbi:MAG: hypothetical protein N2246_01230 [Candidatus Sumerlaeia bacterium]|nr:hypothetical protein [Candidatus Sumerlaeia bacterium]
MRKISGGAIYPLYLATMELSGGDSYPVLLHHLVYGQCFIYEVDDY